MRQSHLNAKLGKRVLRMPPVSALPEPFTDAPEDRVATPQPTGSALGWIGGLLGAVAVAAVVIYGLLRFVALLK